MITLKKTTKKQAAENAAKVKAAIERMRKRKDERGNISGR